MSAIQHNFNPLAKKLQQMSGNSKILVKIVNLGRNVYCEPGASLLDCLNHQKVEISQVCGGMASCGTCRVLVTSPLEELSPRNELELEIAIDKNFAPNERLACQLEPTSELSLSIP